MKLQLATLLRHVRENKYGYLVIGLGLLVQIFLITRPLTFLITNIFPDDAFYYFQIARNIAHGLGSTFDGIHATNGYHPLWLLILVPIFSVFSVGGLHDITPIYVALGLSVVLNAATAVLVFALVSRITHSRLARVFAISLWAFNPFVLYESLNGLETSLALFFLALFFYVAHTAERRDTLQDYLVSGVVGGLLILARVDMAFYVAAFAVFVVLRHGLARSVSRLTRLILPATLLVLPWVAWNYLGFGMLLTSASAATPLVNHTLTLLDSGTGLGASVKAVLYMFVVYGKEVLAHTGATWLVFVFLGSYFAFVADKNAELPRTSKEISVFTLLFIGFVALFLVETGIRFTGRSYYFVSVNLFMVLWAAYLLKLYARRIYLVKNIFFVLFFVVLSTFGIGWYGTLRNQFANQEGMYNMATWMSTHLPAGTSVGVFNAGIEGYFSSVRVVNLDGLVNNSAFHALKKHELWTYLYDEHIAYLSDFDIYLQYRYKPFLGGANMPLTMTELVRIPAGAGIHGSDSIPLYQLPPQTGGGK